MFMFEISALVGNYPEVVTILGSIVLFPVLF